MEKVDVVINVYGKPYQTLCTLKSLLKHCNEHIDKIYFIIENEKLFNSDVYWVVEKFNNIISYTTTSKILNHCNDYSSPIERYNIRYQYGIENSNKNHVFITHNDVLYTGNIIGDLLSQIDTNVGIGLIGQCWNCPAYHQKKCDREKYYEYTPTYEEVCDIIDEQIPPVRTFKIDIDRNNPYPLPECRLNEFSCLINREVTMKECVPNGTLPIFGSSELIDTACAWFRALVLKGYTFKHYDIDKTSKHCFYSNKDGQSAQRNHDIYEVSEHNAKEYYINNFKE